MINTTLKNKYKKYFVIKEVDWHEKKLGYYHVSQIGCGHADLEQNEHSGPCLRDAFMDYVNYIEHTDETTGNFEVGNIFHEKIEDNRKKNNPLCFPEFPMQKLFERNGMKLIIMGSIDIPDQIPLTLQGKATDPIYIDIIDIKSASDYTFPKHKDAKNPTHFDQTKIYAFWLQNYYLNSKFIRIRNLYVTYAAKHNLYMGEQSIPYNNKDCMYKFIDFVNRTFVLHEALLKKKIPDAEPHHWCKYDKYRHRCRDNVIYDDDIVAYNEKELQFLYEKETSKNVMWNGKITKGYLKFKDQFKVKS